ncbi:MAG TPA: glycosyl hydrolase [Candidatus Dormibacteraeota bacterium]|jgi:hypothetical protein|nr:glycosyl hydrolase [Candidatus Dormibacteraeota bacterium]
MSTIYVAVDGGLILVRDGEGAEVLTEPPAPISLAADPEHPERVWCGTDGTGVWRSQDAGRSWRSLEGPLAEARVSAVAVRPGGGAIYAGTDPSALWRSDDGGRSWSRLDALNRLPSAPTWSFPPRPESSHVRWITIDLADPDRLYVCIEAGALIRSIDAGETWSDRVADGPWDTHTLLMHTDAPGRLYSAAGDGFSSPGRGYNQSDDRGDSWTRPDDGIDRHYLYGMAVDPGDPDTVVVSAAHSPRAAHDAGTADATIFRRTGAGPWREVRQGLPDPRGTNRALLATCAGEPGTFYAASNRGLFRSGDGGSGWEPVLAPLPAPVGGRSTAAAIATP